MKNPSDFEKPKSKDVSFYISEIEKSDYFKAAIETFTSDAESTPKTLGKLTDLAPNGIDSEFSVLHGKNEHSESNIWYTALVTVFERYNCKTEINKETNEMVVSCIPKEINFEQNNNSLQQQIISKYKSQIIEVLHSKIEKDNCLTDKIHSEFPQLYKILRIAALKPTDVNLPSLFVELGIINSKDDFCIDKILNPYSKEGAGMIALHQYCINAQLYTGSDNLFLQYIFPEKKATIKKYKTQEEIREEEVKQEKLWSYFRRENAPDSEEILVDLYGVPFYKLVLSQTYDGEYRICGYHPNLDEDNQILSWEDDNYLQGENIEAQDNGVIYCKEYKDALKEYNALIDRYEIKPKNRLIDGKMVNTDSLDNLLHLKTPEEEIALEEEKLRKNKRRRRDFDNNTIENTSQKIVVVDEDEDEEGGEWPEDISY